MSEFKMSGEGKGITGADDLLSIKEATTVREALVTGEVKITKNTPFYIIDDNLQPTAKKITVKPDVKITSTDLIKGNAYTNAPPEIKNSHDLAVRLYACPEHEGIKVHATTDIGHEILSKQTNISKVIKKYDLGFSGYRYKDNKLIFEGHFIKNAEDLLTEKEALKLPSTLEVNDFNLSGQCFHKGEDMGCSIPLSMGEVGKVKNFSAKEFKAMPAHINKKEIKPGSIIVRVEFASPGFYAIPKGKSKAVEVDMVATDVARECLHQGFGYKPGKINYKI